MISTNDRPTQKVSPDHYRELPPHCLNLKFSTDKLLIPSAHCPLTYTLSLISDKTLSLRISPKDSTTLKITPTCATLTCKHRNLTIEIISNKNFNREIDLMHIDEVTNNYCVLKLFVLGPEGVELRTAGTDENFQLAHAFSVSRFSEELEAASIGESSCSKTATVLRPNPEPVLHNAEILILQDNKEYCYSEFPYWVSIAAGELHSLACTSDGRLYSWGTGACGQLGVPAEYFTSQQAELLSTRAREELRDIEFAREYTEKRSKVPYTPVSPRLLHVPFESSVDSVACGMYHSLLLSQGRVFSFGLGDNGRLGLGDELLRVSPTRVNLPENCIKLAAGYHASFFLLHNGTVLSCGSRSEGALGHDSDQLNPTMIPFLQKVHFISSALTHTGVVTTEGKTLLFGSNANNKLGGPSPHTIHSIDNVKIRAVYCGGHHTCALLVNYEVYAWGNNALGQLGLSSSMFHSMASPVKVVCLSGKYVVHLALGLEHSCATTVDGLLYS